MKKLVRQLKGRKQVVFLDLEGTQFSHELIAIGAVKCSLDAEGNIKKIYPGFKKYVLAKNNVGKIVEELTGITSNILAKEGLGFEEVLPLFKKYVGKLFSQTKYITFGAHDIRILNQSLLHTPEADHGMVKTIAKNHLDIQLIVNEYIKDENNNTLSLSNLCKIFEIAPVEPAHDPLNDALMLCYLYTALLNRHDIVRKYYAQTLLSSNSVARPIKKLLAKINKGESVNYDDFFTFLQEEL